MFAASWRSSQRMDLWDLKAESVPKDPENHSGVFPSYLRALEVQAIFQLKSDIQTPSYGDMVTLLLIEQIWKIGRGVYKKRSAVIFSRQDVKAPPFPSETTLDELWRPSCSGREPAAPKKWPPTTSTTWCPAELQMVVGLRMDMGTTPQNRDKHVLCSGSETIRPSALRGEHSWHILNHSQVDSNRNFIG